MANPDIGTGATFSIDGAALSQVVSFSGTIGTRGFADAAEMATLGARPLLPHLTYTPGEITVEVILDGDVTTYDTSLKTGAAAVAGAVEFHIPNDPGAATYAKYTGTGFITGFDFNVPFEDMVTGTYTVQLASALVVTTGP